MVNATEVGTYRSGMGNSPDPSTVQQSNSMPHQHGDSKGGSTAPGNTSETNANQTATSQIPISSGGGIMPLVNWTETMKNKIHVSGTPTEQQQFWESVEYIGESYFKDLLNNIGLITEPIYIFFMPGLDIGKHYRPCYDEPTTGLTYFSLCSPVVLLMNDICGRNGCEMYKAEDGEKIDYELWEVVAHELAHIMEHLIGNVSGKNYAEKENACNARVNKVRRGKNKKEEKLKPEKLPAGLTDAEKRTLMGQSQPCK